MAAIAMPTPYFVALGPDADLTSRILVYKQQTHALAGDQLFLSDPPHLTVFLALYAGEEAARLGWRQLASAIESPRVRIVGWHVFEADALTGNNTLVCAIAPEDKETLRGVQRQVVARMAPNRDRSATELRYTSRFHHLTKEHQENLLREGFPFLGPGWEPHFTVASIRSADWPQVWQALRNQPPSGIFTCPNLRLYRLDNGHPHLVEEKALSQP